MSEMFKMVSGTYDEQVMPAVFTAEHYFRQHSFRERITCSWDSLHDKALEAPIIQSFEIMIGVLQRLVHKLG